MCESSTSGKGCTSMDRAIIIFQEEDEEMYQRGGK